MLEWERSSRVRHEAQLWQVQRRLSGLATLGTEVLILPVEISAGFGTRRIAFFRSPGGLVFEVMQIIESLV